MIVYLKILTKTQGLEVWDMRTSTRLRILQGPVLGYQVIFKYTTKCPKVPKRVVSFILNKICGQLLFLLSSHCKAKVIMIISESVLPPPRFFKRNTLLSPDNISSD